MRLIMPLPFHNVRFPDDISYGSSGGPGYLTTIIPLKSGHEQRLIEWTAPRMRYNVAYGVRSEAQLAALIAFFRARQGRAHAFRFKDWADYLSCAPDASITPLDQVIGTGNGTLTTFSLKKTYTSGGVSVTRPITKPVNGTVRVALAGTEILSGYSVNHDTGVVTFTAPPANGASITAGYAFDVPVRFDTDYLATSLDTYGVGSASDVTCLEVREG
jgi:uncharacterized protein (TIGR02217 family)